jgi:hypothetical protein
MNKVQQLYVLLAVRAALQGGNRVDTILASFAARDVAKRKNAWLDCAEKIKGGATFFEAVADEFDEGVAAILGSVNDNLEIGLRAAIEYLSVTLKA